MNLTMVPAKLMRYERFEDSRVRFRGILLVLLALSQMCHGDFLHAADVETEVITYDAKKTGALNHEGKFALISLDRALVRESDDRYSTIVFMLAGKSTNVQISRVDVYIYGRECTGTARTFVRFRVNSPTQKAIGAEFGISEPACVELEVFAFTDNPNEVSGLPFLKGKLIERMRIQVE